MTNECNYLVMATLAAPVIVTIPECEIQYVAPEILQHFHIEIGAALMQFNEHLMVAQGIARRIEDSRDGIHALHSQSNLTVPTHSAVDSRDEQCSCRSSPTASGS